MEFHAPFLFVYFWLFYSFVSGLLPSASSPFSLLDADLHGHLAIEPVSLMETPGG
jgi:hypothetical protein